jgi:hypothetical protein
MNSTTTLRNDAARTGTNPNFTINSNPWRKYLSLDLSQVAGVPSQHRPVRAGVLVAQNFLFNAGPHKGETHTLVLVATTTNEIFCFGEGDLLSTGSAATPLWFRSLGLSPNTRSGSNMATPIGICGTPHLDLPNRRLFVVAMSQNGSGKGFYTIFNLNLDTGVVSTSAPLAAPIVGDLTSFDGNTLDQRTAINLVGGWLWFGFADYLAFDTGPYFGWVVAVNPDKLSQQLYQRMISPDTFKNFNIFGAGVWGPGGVAAAADGSVYALTGNAPPNTLPSQYWAALNQADGPGGKQDYFQAVVRLGVEISGSSPQLSVLDWFQAANLTQNENAADFDFGGSSALVLPPINGRELVAFIPKDGNIFLLDAQRLGHFAPALAMEKFADALNNGGADTKTAIAFHQTPDKRNILIVGASSNNLFGGFAAFEINATPTPPTMNLLWRKSFVLRDSFGSPMVIANPVIDPFNPPNPIGLAWIIDGDGVVGSFIQNCTIRACDLLTGNVVYDSTILNDLQEHVPSFAGLTSGGNSVFCPTAVGFAGFTQVPPVAKKLTFIVDRSTFGQDEVTVKGAGPGVAEFTPAYWIAVRGVLPTELALNQGNLNNPPRLPTVSVTPAAGLPSPVFTAIKTMLNAAKFIGPVIPENAALPDEPQGFLFPFTISFTGDAGFQEMIKASITSTIVTLTGSITAGIQPLFDGTQIELVIGENPFFVDVNPTVPEQPTWLSFDLRLFKVMENSQKFGSKMTGNAADAPGFIASVIQNLNTFNGTVGGDSFEGLSQDEEASALEFHPTDNSGHKIFNFAVARVRLLGKNAGQTPTPVRVFFRLFQAQNTVSDFDTSTTYRFASDNLQNDDHKIPLLGVQNDAHGNPEYVTIPCFASPRINLTTPASMATQYDHPNAYSITVTPGVEVHAYFGCWVDINQPDQRFLPLSPPGTNLDGPWTQQKLNGQLYSIQEAVVHAPHQCLIAEIRYDGAPTIPKATSATSDKLAQRNIAWIDGPNPGIVESRRMAHPIQVKLSGESPQPNPDELMIFWGSTPKASQAQLYLPALGAVEITSMANSSYPSQNMFVIDEHTVGFEAAGVTFIPVPTGSAFAAGLLTVDLPAGIKKGAQYAITVRQLTYAALNIEPVPEVAEDNEQAILLSRFAWQRVDGAFQFIINVKTKDTILFNEERLLATLRWMILKMSVKNRWYPVLQRYIDQVVGRVQGFGGDPGQIIPSPTGTVSGLPHPSDDGDDDKDDQISGKVKGLIFDCSGDFKGCLPKMF